jgi:hypothetical protein
MAKMTMHQELEVLKGEVELLTKERESRDRKEQIELEKLEQVNHQEALKSAQNIKDKTSQIEDELRQKAQEFYETFKHDYENISPALAVTIFAIGVVFGHTISSK